MPALKNTKHERFAQGVASGKSAAEAYIDAGFKANTGNASTLKASQSISKRVSEILTRERTLEERATEKAIDKLAITKEMVFAEMVKVGFANMADYLDVTGDSPTFKFKDIDRDKMAAVSSLTTETLPNGTRKIKFTLWDKRASLVDLGRELGMFKQKVDARTFVARITSDMTPQEAADAYRATLEGAVIEGTFTEEAE